MAGGRAVSEEEQACVQNEIVQVLTSQAMCDAAEYPNPLLESVRGRRCASFEPISSLIEIELTNPLTQAG